MNKKTGRFSKQLLEDDIQHRLLLSTKTYMWSYNIWETRRWLQDRSKTHAFSTWSPKTPQIRNFWLLKESLNLYGLRYQNKNFIDYKPSIMHIHDHFTLLCHPHTLKQTNNTSKNFFISNKYLLIGINSSTQGVYKRYTYPEGEKDSKNSCRISPLKIHTHKNIATQTCELDVLW